MLKNDFNVIAKGLEELGGLYFVVIQFSSKSSNLGIDRGPGPGPGRGCHFLPRSSPGQGEYKNWPGPGLNFKFIYGIFRRIRRPLKCKNPPLKIGVVSYNEYKSHNLIFT